jgi:hypothetical protein
MLSLPGLEEPRACEVCSNAILHDQRRCDECASCVNACVEALISGLDPGGGLRTVDAYRLLAALAPDAWARAPGDEHARKKVLEGGQGAQHQGLASWLKVVLEALTAKVDATGGRHYEHVRIVHHPDAKVQELGEAWKQHIAGAHLKHAAPDKPARAKPNWPHGVAVTWQCVCPRA